MIPVIINRNRNPPEPKPDGRFRFVDQGNYLKKKIVPKLTLYSDSATSCIVTIVAAQKEDEISATLAHLDSPDCIKTFFKLVTLENYDTVQIYAQGANPPDNDTARENAAQLVTSIQALGGTIASVDLFLLEGSPRDENRGDFGIAVDATGSVTVSNQSYALELIDRDPTCGGQTVYCIMRRQEHPPIEIRNAALPFTHAELVELSSIALSYRKNPNDPTSAFTNIVNLQNAVIREDWSTTPQYEAPWFSDQLKQGACFAISMAPVTTLSSYYLSKDEERPFDRLRRSILGTF